MALFSDFTFGGLKERIHFRLQHHPKWTDKLGVAANKGIQNLWVYARKSKSIYEAFTGQNGAGDWVMEYILPDNFYTVDTVSINGYPCDALSLPQWVETRGQQSLVRADPSQYYVLDDGPKKTICLFPRPIRQAKIEVYGTQGPALLTLDADLLPYLEVESEAVEAFAVAWLTRGMPGQEETFRIFEGLRKEDRNEAKANLGLDQIHSTIRVR